MLLSIQGGSDLGLFEINEAAQLVANSAAVDANIIFGAVIDDALGDEVLVTVIAAGFDEQRPSRPATVTVVPLVGGGAPATSATSAASPAANGGANGSGSSASRGNAANGSSTTATSGAAEPPASAPAATGPAHAGASGQWATPPPAFAPSSRADEPATPPAATQDQDRTTVDPIAEVPVQPAAEVPSGGYTPAPVSFVSDDDDAYGGYAAGRGDGTQGGAQPWKDAGRGKQEKIFDVTTGRRRPVVFEEEDDLDVPDFLK